jgi:hypothetical protein
MPVCSLAESVEIQAKGENSLAIEADMGGIGQFDLPFGERPDQGVDASCIVTSRYNSRIHSTDQQEFLWVLDMVVCFVPNHLLRIILRLEGNRLVRDRHNCFVSSKNFITLMRDFNTAETLVEPVQSDLKVLLVVHGQLWCIIACPSAVSREWECRYALHSPRSDSCGDHRRCYL